MCPRILRIASRPIHCTRNGCQSQRTENKDRHASTRRRRKADAPSVISIVTQRFATAQSIEVIKAPDRSDRRLSRFGGALGVFES